MHYFVTGGTGFIGRFLVPRLLDRGGIVHLLVRESSLEKVESLRTLWGVGEDQVKAVVGDLSKNRLGLSKRDIAEIKAYQRPPPATERVFSAVATLLKVGKKYKSAWDGVKAMTSDPNFLMKLESFDMNQVTRKQLLVVSKRAPSQCCTLRPDSYSSVICTCSLSEE